MASSELELARELIELNWHTRNVSIRAGASFMISMPFCLSPEIASVSPVLPACVP